MLTKSFKAPIAKSLKHGFLTVVLAVSSFDFVLGNALDANKTNLLTYSEITELYRQPQPSPDLKIRLRRLLTEPFVQNISGQKTPVIASSPTLGEFIRVAQWNIQRGLEYDALKAV